MWGRWPGTAAIQSAGVCTEMPKVLSSQMKTRGSGTPRWAHQRAALSAPSEVECFAEASPNVQMTTLSWGSFPSSPSCRARGIESAAPTDLGRCEAIVLVCGGMNKGTLPPTLCRPPPLGSSLEAAKESSESYSTVDPGSCLERCTTKPPLR